MSWPFFHLHHHIAVVHLLVFHFWSFLVESLSCALPELFGLLAPPNPSIVMPVLGCCLPLLVFPLCSLWCQPLISISLFVTLVFSSSSPFGPIHSSSSSSDCSPLLSLLILILPLIGWSTAISTSSHLSYSCWYDANNGYIPVSFIHIPLFCIWGWIHGRFLLHLFSLQSI